MAQKETDQLQETMTALAAGSSLLGLVRLMARQAAREALEAGAARPAEISGRNQSEPEDPHEAQV